MILAEKIMNLRKKNGWSQEELAGKLNVSRQSVSKWESAMSVPELDKILLLADIFEVSTDYLLKDDRMEEEYIPGSPDKECGRRVSMEEAQEFIRIRTKLSWWMALGVAACILSPVCLILLGDAAVYGMVDMTEGMAEGIGLTVLISMVTCAVADFIFCGCRLQRYEYLEKENFELCYGVEGMVKERKEKQRGAFIAQIVSGVVLCIVGVIPLFLAEAFAGGEMAETAAVGLLLLFVAAGVFLLVKNGMVEGAYEQLLQEGDYTPEGKKAERLIGKIAAVYWCVVAAVYAGISLWTGRWDRTWIIWAVTGILFGAIAGYIKMNQEK
ncbi:MAG: helix-turn-helix transcriptional regulator [Clostridiales bacterium]|nr:helix-turn-helix transcriptional regulator [Clostridiales bacterium]